MASKFTKAVREQVKLRVILIGPSGSGKSYSALRLARGIGGKVAYINTEGDRGGLYAGEFEYDMLTLDAPFTPESYVEAIADAAKAGYDVLVVDSASHEWDGPGGCLEIHNRLPDTNSYTAWAKVTPRHQRFVNAIINAPMHLIVCVRGKDEYVLEEKDGKKIPRKVGLGGIQRKGLEYEFHVSFQLDQKTNAATTDKDNTHLFEGDFAEVLTEQHGEALREWSRTGAASGGKPKKAASRAAASKQASAVDALASAGADMVTCAKYAIGAGLAQDAACTCEEEARAILLSVSDDTAGAIIKRTDAFVSAASTVKHGGK